ncbi:MAG: DUF4350 domain-containing protein [Gemmatimonadota bacterium]
MTFKPLIIAIVCIAASSAAGLDAQQVPDTMFVPRVAPPVYRIGTGPRVLIDGAHANFHKVGGRYMPFAQLARRDGYRVSGGTTPFSDASLSAVDILVIANALAPRNDSGKWNLPTPSAFTREEIAAVRRFVERGGSLLVIADHMPFGGSTEALGSAFGVTWINGFAYDEKQNSIFRLSRAKGLAPHPIFDGRKGRGERIDSIVVFTGSAFWLPGGGAPLLRIPERSRVLMPHVAWQFSDSTASVSAAGMLQGAALLVGKGRVVAAGEAAMFSAQRSGPQGAGTMGFNEPTAPQNAQFVLNVLHWLSGLLPAK